MEIFAPEEMASKDLTVEMLNSVHAHQRRNFNTFRGEQCPPSSSMR
jgi:hypothetical protein